MAEVTEIPYRATSETEVRTLTVFAPVEEGQLAELAVRLGALSGEEPSPFAAVPGTHFARLALLRRESFHRLRRPSGMRPTAWLIDLLTHGGRRQRPDQPSLSYLLFTAAYDGSPDERGHAEYVNRLRVHLQAGADELFGLCLDYPGWQGRARFQAFFDERSREAGYVFRAFDEPRTVEQTRSALGVRQRMMDLAVRTQGLDEQALVEQLRRELPALMSGHEHPTGHRPLAQQRHPAEQVPAATTPLRAAPVRAPLADADLPVARGRTFAGEPATEPELADVQNLIASGYPRHHAFRHLMLAIEEPAAARRWLGRVAEVIPSAAWAQQRVHRLPATAPRDQARAGDPPEFPGLAVHVAFSHAGLARLGLPDATLAGFPGEFRAGMARREAGLTPGCGTSGWQPPFAVAPQPEGAAADGEERLQAPVHVLVMISAADEPALARELAQRPWLIPAAAAGFSLLGQFSGGRLRGSAPSDPAAGSASGSTSTAGGAAAKAEFREHFGFVDGLSQPRIHGVTVGVDAAELPAGEALLGYRDVDGDTAGNGIDPELARNGSFLVYRKLYQDVAAFRELTARLAGELGSDGVDPRQLAAAKLMGRWPDGTPLVLSSDRPDPTLSRKGFDFQGEDAEGLRCPVGAHIRRANPRDSRPVDPQQQLTQGKDPDLEVRLGLRHRMLRRGVPYGDPLPESDVSPAPGQGRDDDRGLLFIALVGDIKRQFEFVQAQWLADGNSFRLGGDRDVFAGASLAGTKFTVQGRPPCFVEPDPERPLVTCQGGEYFFLPGLAALKRLSLG